MLIDLGAVALGDSPFVVQQKPSPSTEGGGRCHAVTDEDDYICKFILQAISDKNL